MNSKKTVSRFALIAFIGGCVLAGSGVRAEETTVVFHGTLVNAGCDAQVLGASAQPGRLKPLKVTARLSVGLVSHDDACDEVSVPVSTAYAESTSITADTRSGIITLTYQ